MSKCLIYTSCFHQEIYTDIVSNLINSFTLTNSSVDFLIYTTTEYKELIQKKCPNAKLLFFEKNFYKTMNQARISKVDIFDYPNIDKYEKVLYLDADSLLLKDPISIFDEIKDDLVYVVGEGNILNEGEYWGRSIFLKENAEYIDREGIGAYAMGFKNITTIKKLFIKIKQSFYLEMYQNKLRFYDQPFLNFFLINNNMCNTESLKTYIKSRPSAEVALSEGLTVAHFAGCPGHGNIKLDLFNEFKTNFDNLKPKEKVDNEEIISLKRQLEEIREKLEALLKLEENSK